MADTLYAPPDPLGVRAAAREVVSRARQVRIDDAAVERTADAFAASRFAVPAWNDRYHFLDGTARTANYVLALDTLNFSFWGEPRWRIAYRGETLDGYWALAAALKRAVEAGEPILEADYWAAITSAELGRLLAGEAEIPLLEARVTALREAGRWLLDRFGGQFASAVDAVGRSAPGVAGLLASELESFRDVARYAGRDVPLLKRAQICAADLYGAFGGRDWGNLAHMAALTAFADYKLPQILRSLGVLVYADELARRVDSRTALAPGSPEEVEIRASTVEAVERLTAALRARGRPVRAFEVDWYLWEAAQGGSAHGAPAARPYHRTRTVYY